MINTTDALDTMVVGLAHEGAVRLRAIRSTALVEEARIRHGTSPTATVALGQLLTGALLLGGDLKARQSLTITIAGANPEARMMAVVEADHTVRGTIADPSADRPLTSDGRYDIADLIGLPGHLSVVKEQQLKEPYSGIVPLQVGHIAKELACYLLISEQIPSAVSLGVRLADSGEVELAAGFLIQLMPGAEDSEEAKQIEKRISMTPSMTELMEMGDSPLHVVELLAGGPIDVLASEPVAFQCSCSRDRFTQALLTLGPDELAQLRDEDPNLTLTCQFCRAAFEISAEELDELIDESRSGRRGEE